MDELFYRNTLSEVVSRGNEELERIFKGDFSRVCCNMSGEYDGGGNFDINSKNRLLIAYYLLWSNKLPDNAESIISQLLAEEISAHSQDAFQGCGDGLAIISALLSRYNENGKYDELFLRAKNANFDCECGYSIENCLLFLSEKLETKSPYDCIFTLIDLGAYEEAARLAEKYAEDHPPVSKSDYHRLICINKFTGRKKENIPYYQKLVDMKLELDDPWEIASALRDLIAAYIEFGEYGKAYHAIGRAREYLFKIHEWQDCGLGRDYFEFIAELVLAMPEKVESIWSEWRDFSVKYPENMSSSCLKKLFAAAKAVSDSDAADIFFGAMDKKNAPLNISSNIPGA